MNKPTIETAIRVLDNSSEDEEESLCAAVLLLLLLLQEKSCYTNQKARPLSEFKSLVHWASLAFPPIATRLGSPDGHQLSEDVIVRRSLGEDGKFALQSEGLIPPARDAKVETYKYEVCISFAGEQREVAEEIATILRDEYSTRVFYDDFEKTKLWGKDLFNHLYETYSRRSRFCLILFSSAYLEKNWTTHELKAAQSRVVKERSSYVLPLVCEPGVVPPIEFENISYLTLDRVGVPAICKELHDRVWNRIKTEWLSEDEVVDVLNESMQFNMFLSPFRAHLDELDEPSEQLITLLFSLIWISSNDKIDTLMTGLLDYILYAFRPVANRFDANDELMLMPPNGGVRRMIGTKDGSILMRGEFWNPIADQWKAENPGWFGDPEEDEAETEANSENTAEQDGDDQSPTRSEVDE